MSSLSKDKEVQQITARLAGYVQALTYHQTTTNSNVKNLAFRAAPAQSETAQTLKRSVTEPCFLVRYDRDENYVGREDIMQEIDRRFKAGQHRVAIAGVVGIG